MKKFVVHKNLSLRDFTDEVYPQGSFVFSRLLKSKDIKVNGVRVCSDIPVKIGDEVIYYTTPLQEAKPSHTIIYEDENILISDKPDGVSAEALAYELSEKCRPVHRLDRNTKGLMAFAKTDDAEKTLIDAFKTQNIQKNYIALCKNSFAVSSQKICAYLKKDAFSALVQISDVPKNGYVRIETEYKVLKAKGDIAIVGITLHTGKTHQIRAHMAHIGCPVLGDEKYGDRNLNKKYALKRQCLIAKQLKFSLGGKYSYLNGKTFTSTYSLELPQDILNGEK
ncbi:MAG: RluA family pseudouridine synthase [Clostridia bacterium]|nr:RluA family pseudouridine synthase [Clostridia bacterium]